MANGYRPDFSFLPKTQDQLPSGGVGGVQVQYPYLSDFNLQGGANTMFGFTPGFSAGNIGSFGDPGDTVAGSISGGGGGTISGSTGGIVPTGSVGGFPTVDLAPGVPIGADLAGLGGPNMGTYGPQTFSPTQYGTLYDTSTYTDASGNTFLRGSMTPDLAPNPVAGNAPTSITDTGGSLQPGFANVNPDGSFSPVDTGGTGTSTGLDTGSAGSAGGSNSPVTAGPGMPVADQGLASAAQQAGTSISQAISSPLSGAIKTTGSDITGAGQTVSSGVQSAAQTASATGVGILAGLEAYIGEFFLYAAVLIAGVVFLAIGLEKFGGPKLQIAMAKK